MTTRSSTAFPAAFPHGRVGGAFHPALKLLESLSHGTLKLQLPDGTQRCFGGGGFPQAAVTLRNWRPLTAALRSGDIGFARSYIAGDWSTPDLVELLELILANGDQIAPLVRGSWAGRLWHRWRQLLRRNTRGNSRNNVHAHYDLGNAFYALWLDEEMDYSSAWFEGDLNRPLRAAQHAKVRRALRMAGVGAGDRVLDIGCGWGALAERGAAEFGAHVTGVTLSREQLALGQRRLQAAGLGQRTELRLQDYRDIADEPYDAICSIEMLEAVGRAYWPTYFQTLHRLLKPGRRACIQSIVIDDAHWDGYIGSTDFIRQAIFPGGCLPCPRELRRQARASGFELVDEFAFGADYAETLRRWRERVMAARDRVLQLGFDDRFLRTWEFYLAYCEAAFKRARISVVQYTLQRG